MLDGGLMESLHMAQQQDHWCCVITSYHTPWNANHAMLVDLYHLGQKDSKAMCSTCGPAGLGVKISAHQNSVKISLNNA